MVLSSKMFLKFLTLRLLMAVFTNNYIEPDETWQSVEVTHKLVFGRGYLTWEWMTEEPIRSSLHPLLFAPLFLLLKITGTDFPWLVELSPRLLCGLISALGDYWFYKFYKENISSHTSSFAFFYGSNAWLNHSSSRTLINSLEMSLTSIALCFYSRALTGSRVNDMLVYVSLITTSFVMRMTTAVFWLPLVLYHLWLLVGKGQFQEWLLKKAALASLAILLTSVVIDSWFYGKFVVVFWNFFKINVLNSVSDQYGSEPVHKYLIQSLPNMLNGLLIFALTGFLSLWKKKSCRIYILTTVWTCLWLSFGLKHKEDRFIQPIIPILIAISSYGFDAKFRQSKFVPIFKMVYLLNHLALISFYMFHTYGSTDIIKYVKNEALAGKLTNVYFLLPCHYTPYYSYIHMDLEMDFPTCEPLLASEKTTKAEKDTKDNFIIFEKNQEYGLKNIFGTNLTTVASHVIAYDKPGLTDQNKHFQNFLQINRLTLGKVWCHKRESPHLL